MDKVITTALLTIAAVVGVVMVINAVLPSLGRTTGSVLSSSSAAADIIKTDVESIAVASDTSAAPPKVYVWIKNVGTSHILAIEKSDLFLEEVNASFDRLTHDSAQTGSCTYSPPAGSWAYCIEDGETVWKSNVTVKVIIARATLPVGDYRVEFYTNNGVSDEEPFSV